MFMLHYVCSTVKYSSIKPVKELNLNGAHFNILKKKRSQVMNFLTNDLKECGLLIGPQKDLQNSLRSVRDERRDYFRHTSI